MVVWCQTVVKILVLNSNSDFLKNYTLNLFFCFHIFFTKLSSYFNVSKQQKLTIRFCYRTNINSILKLDKYHILSRFSILATDFFVQSDFFLKSDWLATFFVKKSLRTKKVASGKPALEREKNFHLKR